MHTSRLSPAVVRNQSNALKSLLESNDPESVDCGERRWRRTRGRTVACHGLSASLRTRTGRGPLRMACLSFGC